ncbi:MAG TPA: hypothetical protein RMG48_06940 [Myxococcales bacterium LLY-WYZ-16_1]|nr:hypothetical protein [Myxococcales bacterium LLY-WYZ-16_1]
MSWLRIAVGALVLAGCRSVPEWQRTPHDRMYQRVPPPRLHPPIRDDSFSEGVFFTRYSVVRPLGQLISPATYLRGLEVGPEAMDVNAFGQVVDSEWFTNRIGRRPMDLDALRRGPNTIDGPAPGSLFIERAKVEGVSPGFWVRDGRGRRFIVKLDHPAYPGLSSGAELVATKILHAAGYNVPQNFVAELDLDRLVVLPDATAAGPYGSRVPLTEEAVEAMLLNANPSPRGTVHCLFSRIIDGIPVGPFTYRGVRADDPNDEIPHERRRSLRGLGTLFAWLNNTDSRASNSLDVWLEQRAGLGYVRHYLLDFGDALGASDTTPKYISEGYEYLVDLPAMAVGFLGFGIHYRWWLPVQRSPLRSVGTFESQVFDPERWRPAIPNPAFQAATARDRYWAAAIVARFGRPQLEAIVETADYPETGATEEIVRILLERRRKILQWAFRDVLPLDDLQVRGHRVRFTDLAVRTEISLPTGYRWEVTDSDGQVLDGGECLQPEFDLTAAAARVADPERPFLTLRIWRQGSADGPSASPHLDLHVRILGDRVLPVGLERAVR